MRLILKEDPKEWRKAVLFAAAGLVVFSAVLRWRRVLSNPCWLQVLILLLLVAITACLRPRCFRGYYRFTNRIAFGIVQLVGRIVLVVFFALVITPLGLLMRLWRKDPLQLQARTGAQTYWHPCQKSTPLDRLF